MNDFLITEMSLYPWMAWLLVILAGAGLGYVAVWAYRVQTAVYAWLGYRRLVWRSKAAVRRRLLDGSLYGGGCADCRERDAMVVEAMLSATAGDDPPEYQHPDGDDPGYDWEGPGDDWSPKLAWGPAPPMPSREVASLASLDEILKKADEMGLLDEPPVCTNAGCYRYGESHPGPCEEPPTMPAACYPAMGLADGPAMPPQDWSGHAASLEVLGRGDDSPTLTGIVAAELGHDTTEAAVDSMWTRAMASEVQAMITDGVVIPTDETGRSQG